MVDLTLLQSVSYMAVALGVCIAAIYYIMNLRETNNNRKTTVTTNIINQFYTKENALLYDELHKTEWKDFSDFTHKYDSRVNPENWAVRQYFWGAYDVLGYQWKEGLVDIGLISRLAGGRIEATWKRFSPIIEEYRKTDWPADRYKDFEDLAEELIRLRKMKEPNRVIGGTSMTIPYDQAYGKKN
ncbi:MAG: hypothetical protein NTY03_00995 [Candidatus Bathyarchaeota archaeon]|nr:hypothetical protein [Candidatus Bathyarchaeota archaeon]